MDLISWGITTSSATVAVAAFLASMVEFVEALTIVLAVGTVRGWRPALIGAGAGAVLLIVLVAIFGPLLSFVPITWLQLVVGILLLLFGMRWLRKAVLRSAGVIALHDEVAIYAKETEFLKEAGRPIGRWDPIALITSFKAVVLEGLEVIFIVIAVGSTGASLVPAAVGAGAALLLVCVVGVIVHRPLAQVPENTLKFTVGVLLSAFGVFWIGEGAGLAWPGEDLAIIGLIAGFLVAAFLSVQVARRSTAVEEVL
ncbi:MAG: TMEM165/GDT1 family protein [Rhodospirillales bacterium]|nr:TMEM165/GDT1 family protein [Rhodospirillales bacterium]